MSMVRRARELMETTVARAEKATGKVLGDEAMPRDQQIREVSTHLRDVGAKVSHSTGRALGDADMPVKDQVKEVKVHIRRAGDRVRYAVTRRR